MADFNKRFEIAAVNKTTNSKIQAIIDRASTLDGLNIREELKKEFDSIKATTEWTIMTGSEASFEPTADTLDDTIFGGTGSWSSIQAGAIGHTGSSNSLIKGYAGYEAKVSYVENILDTNGNITEGEEGTATNWNPLTFTPTSNNPTTDQLAANSRLRSLGINLPAALGINLANNESYYELTQFRIGDATNNSTYVISNGSIKSSSKAGTGVISIIDGTNIVFAIDKEDFLEKDIVNELDNDSNVNFLIPGIIALTSATITTGDIKIYALEEIGGAMSFTLGQTVNALKDSTFKKMRTNQGYMTYTQGLRTITLEMGGLYEKENSNRLLEILEARVPVVVEIRPKGDNNLGTDKDDSTFVRGMFYLTGLPQSGAVGQLEEQTFSMNLFVRSTGAGNVKLLDPFTWYTNAEEIGEANEILINAYRNREHILFRYIETGDIANGYKAGIAVLTDLSLAGGLEDMNKFTVSLTGSDNPVLFKDGAAGVQGPDSGASGDSGFPSSNSDSSNDDDDDEDENA